MKYRFKVFIIIVFLLGCANPPSDPEKVLDSYIKAANEHNIEKVKDMYADSIVWYFGPLTFKGKEEAIAPLEFDKGANTKLIHTNIYVNGDTVDFHLLETNNVISALGVPELHHFPRFVVKNGLIHLITSTKPPTEFKAYADSVAAFANWLQSNSPDMYNKIWPDGNFNFSEETGKIMPAEVLKWRDRFK
ncbi:MAG: nuclear transport factor 2 family protein [Ignavibacteria bacterium]|nr:nuclear transport factor 2 family protein [Ignavibacteria bacterium]MBT8381833.1 nuclear transport factor 2 family protein [Ignavibacteria bacterium]MBT8392434.1 nuclear transport factor 2 family protein [Ignavibacteria bacterium]NNJ52902.1 nuclear transport factor 2 family protein [Ignavibacteriaceae bacterium]NNL19935.1 nuclear transport factor 2 family protein [Ignavibacteriaceae bacterium]